jgi:hypothetical protein
LKRRKRHRPAQRVPGQPGRQSQSYRGAAQSVARLDPPFRQPQQLPPGPGERRWITHAQLTAKSCMDCRTETHGAVQSEVVLCHGTPARCRVLSWKPLRHIVVPPHPLKSTHASAAKAGSSPRTYAYPTVMRASTGQFTIRECWRKPTTLCFLSHVMATGSPMRYAVVERLADIWVTLIRYRTHTKQWCNWH